MQFAPYRRVLALPGVRALLALSLFARIPVLAGSMVLTLHVVIDLKLGFGAAGAVFSASILGSAIGSPWLGRFTDRYGLRPVVIFGTVAAAVFWGSAGFMSYPVLLVAGFVSSLIQIPVFTLSRQGLAALVPEEQRRPAYSLDSMAVELSYMAGPSIGVLVVTAFSAQAAIWAVFVGVIANGVAFSLLNPPLRSEAESGTPSVRMPLRTWLRPGIVAVLLTVAGATLILGATEVVVVAVLKQAGELSWASVVLIAWGIYSMTGGLVYGGLRRAPGPGVLMLLLGLTTIALAVAGSWIWLCVALIPAGLLCAPTLAGAADAMSRLAPAAVRGEAMGYYGSAMAVGMALGSPFAGAAVDLVGPAWGFVLAGAGGAVVAGVALLVERLGRRDLAGLAPAVPAASALALAASAPAASGPAPASAAVGQ